MSRKTTIFLAAIALAATLSVAICVLMGAGGDVRAAGAALFHFDPDNILEARITNGEESFVIKKTGAGWRIGPQPNDQASEAAVKKLIECARTTLVLDRIPAGEIHDRDQLSEYGLRQSRLQLDFEGDSDHPLLIGKDSAAEDRAYVRFENTRDVYLVPDEIVRILQLPRGDFRDRNLTTFKPDRIDRMRLRRPGVEIEILRDGDGWKIIRPLEARADTAAVTAFLANFFRLRIEGFVADEGGDPGMMGLAEPSAEVSLYAEGDKEPAVIRAGGESPEGGVYARLLPRDILCRLPDAAPKLFAADLASLRDHSLARLDLDLVDKIRIESAADQFTLSRCGEGWSLQHGEHLLKGSPGAIQRLVDALALVKAGRYAPATDQVLQQNGLVSPLVTVTFLSVLSENTPEAVAGEHPVMQWRLASPLPDGTIPVHSAGSPEITFVPANLLEAVPTDVSAWVAP